MHEITFANKLLKHRQESGREKKKKEKKGNCKASVARKRKIIGCSKAFCVTRNPISVKNNTETSPW